MSIVKFCHVFGPFYNILFTEGHVQSGKFCWSGPVLKDLTLLSPFVHYHILILLNCFHHISRLALTKIVFICAPAALWHDTLYLQFLIRRLYDNKTKKHLVQDRSKGYSSDNLKCFISIQFDPIRSSWSNLNKFEQVWSILNMFVQVWSIWHNLKPIWSDLTQFDHIWFWFPYSVL